MAIRGCSQARATPSSAPAATLDGTRVLQAKGFPYALQDLLGRSGADRDLSRRPVCDLAAHLEHVSPLPCAADGTIEHVTYISGDTWNVNPIALRRVANLFCKNERAVIRLRLAGTAHLVTLVPVAAILVASMRLHFLDVVMNMSYRGAAEIDCAAAVRKGDELGWFEHGSTIIVFAPRGFRLCDGIGEGTPIRMGRALMHLP